MESPFFIPHAVPATTLQELLFAAPERRVKLFAMMRSEGIGRELEAAQAAFDKTQGEVAGGKMSEAITEAEVTKQHGPFWNVVRRFGIKQGVNSKGFPKYPTTDDHTENDNNNASGRTQKVVMAGVNIIMLIIRVIARAFLGEQPLGGTGDMKAAYRQVALTAAHVSLAATAIFNPKTGEIDLRELWAVGAAVRGSGGSAELQVRRMACTCWATPITPSPGTLLRRLLLRGPDWIRRVRRVGLPRDAPTARRHPGPREVPTAAVCLRGPRPHLRHERTHRDGPIRGPAKKKRVCDIIDEIRQIIARDSLAPSQATRLVGKADFVNTTLYRRVGRVGLAGLKARQYVRQGIPARPDPGAQGFSPLGHGRHARGPSKDHVDRRDRNATVAPLH